MLKLYVFVCIAEINILLLLLSTKTNQLLMDTVPSCVKSVVKIAADSVAVVICGA